MLTRRSLLAGGLALAGLAWPKNGPTTGPVVEIRMRSASDGSRVWFDPVGLLLESDATVTWIVDANVHTTTAYHPQNENHSLRIPEGAKPWNSGYLVNPGDRFSVTLTIPGVYDYFCAPHEAAGMVGRLIIGQPTGPGALTFDYFLDRWPAPNWRKVPPAAQNAFPNIDAILRQKVVRVS